VDAHGKYSGMKVIRGFFYLILLLASTAQAFVSEADDEHPFTLSFDEETLVVKDGKAQVFFFFGIPEDHYLYKDQMQVEVETQGVTVSLELPPAEKKYDKFQDEELDIYHGDIAVTARFHFQDGFDFAQNVMGKITYQGCSPRMCFRALRVPFSFPLAVPTLTTASSLPMREASFLDLLKIGNFQDLLGQGLFVSLAITFLGGVLTSFTGCVLPVIPLTLTFMGVNRRIKVRRRWLTLIIFVGGLSLTFAILGVVTALLGLTLGFSYQSPTFLLFLTLFLFAMGLWMLGLLNLNLPSSWQNAIVKVHPHGHFRDFYAGLTVGFLALPCVGPIAGPLLAYIAQTKDVWKGFLFMQTYALGVSVLFFVIAFFSHDWIARFGKKSDLIKKFVGILLLLGSFYYGKVLAKTYTGQGPETIKGTAFSGLSLSEALQQAKRDSKMVIVDFFADWCEPCHEWNRAVWSHKDVVAALKDKALLVQIDCTTETPACAEAVERFDVVGWPTVIFMDEMGRERENKRVVGRVMTANEFLKYREGFGVQ
jgi:thiol:disulfide interchange protein DsbD